MTKCQAPVDAQQIAALVDDQIKQIFPDGRLASLEEPTGVSRAAFGFDSGRFLKLMLPGLQNR